MEAPPNHDRVGSVDSPETQARLRRWHMGTDHRRSQVPRIYGHEDALGDPSLIMHLVAELYMRGRHTVSIESFAIIMIISITESDGMWMVVFACHPSDPVPYTIGTLDSWYGALFITHVVTSVWLMAKICVWLAAWEEGELGSKGESRSGSSRETSAFADPFVNIQTIAGSSTIPIDSFDLLAWIQT